MKNPLFDEPNIAAPETSEAAPPITIDRARRYYMEAAQATSENDTECEKDVDYFHNNQISSETKAKWKARGQPPLTVNKITPAIMGILGIHDSTQSDPICYPRNPEQQDTADLATKIVRYLNDQADVDSVMSFASKDFYTYGTCAVLIGDGAHDGCDSISVIPIAWEDFFYDPLSKLHDFSDARYLGIRRWFDTEEIAHLYPESYAKLGSPFDTGLGDWFDNKGVEEKLWLDRDRRRIRVLELYFKDDDCTWQKVVFCSQGFLEHGVSGFVDDRGQPICPLRAASYEVNRKTGERYGPIRAMRPIQDAINARHSKLIHETNNRRVMQTVEGIDPKQKFIAMQEMAKADGALPFGWGPAPMQDIVDGQFMMLQKSEADLSQLAPTPAVLGRMGSGDSGKARQVLQDAGLTEWARSFTNLLKLKETVHRHLWFGAKQFLTTRQWIRYTGEQRAAQFIEVNVPTGVRLVPDIDPQTGQPVIDPATGQVKMKQEVVKERAVAMMDVDITLDTIPENKTLEHETMQEIMRYAASAGISPLDPQFKVLLQMFPLTDKTRTLERWDAVRAEMMQEQQAQLQMQQAQVEAATKLQEMTAQAKVQKDGALARKANADAMKTEQLIQHEHAAREMFQSLHPVTPPGL